jgi:hypothetical protein
MKGGAQKTPGRYLIVLIAGPCHAHFFRQKENAQLTESTGRFLL